MSDILSDNHMIALQLLFAQGLLGAFDTLYHHEYLEKLPQRMSAAKELMIHAIRSVLYAVLFFSLAWWVLGGVFAWIFVGIVIVEILLTLWDFVIEDQTRQLPPTERVLHTILAMNGGALFGLLATQIPHWFALPSVLYYHNQAWLSIGLSCFAVGVFLSGLRDGIAALRLYR